VANPTLADLRASVRDRLHLSANDPSFPDDRINRAINMAMGDLATAQPNGWWFQRCEITQQNTAGDVATVAIHLADRTRIVEKIGYVYASLDGDYWTEIKQRERQDAIRSAGGVLAAGGLPYSWGYVRLPSSGGQRNDMGVVFDPALANLAYIRVGVVVGPPDFANDTDTMAYLPAPFAGAIVERACSKLGRQKRKVGQLTTRRRYITEVTMAATAADAWTKDLRRWFDKPYHGPGQATEHRRI